MPQRYEKEIEDILQQAGDLGPKGKSAAGHSLPKLVWLHLAQSLRGKPWSISPGRVMLTAAVLLLSAIIMGIALLAWAGLLLFIVGYAMFFVRPPQVEKRWRGQAIDYGRQKWWDRLRRKMR